MKKLLLVLILLLLPLTVLAEDAESRRDGAFFYQIADGEATLTGCDWDAMQADSLYMFAEPPVSLEIPATLGGYPVTSIGGGVFCSLDGCPVDAPFEVVLPEGFALWMPTPSPNASTRRKSPCPRRWKSSRRAVSTGFPPKSTSRTAIRAIPAKTAF